MTYYNKAKNSCDSCDQSDYPSYTITWDSTNNLCRIKCQSNSVIGNVDYITDDVTNCQCLDTDSHWSSTQYKCYICDSTQYYYWNTQS
jgi:hypothetical protein